MVGVTDVVAELCKLGGLINNDLVHPGVIYRKQEFIKIRLANTGSQNII